MVRIQDLSLAFNGQTLFEHLNLTLLPNEWVSLLGSSGVGKSTLLRLLAGIETQGVVQGKILLRGCRKKRRFIRGYQLLIMCNCKRFYLGENLQKPLKKLKFCLKKWEWQHIGTSLVCSFRAGKNSGLPWHAP